jgi:integrase
MATPLNGTVFKRCGCTQPITAPDGNTTRKQLGKNCPQLTYADGRWAREHGTWRFQLEIPFTDGGQREHLRAGFATETETRNALTTITALLRLADHTEEPDQQRRAITALIRERLAANAPLPDEDEIRKRLSLGQAVDNPLTVETFLTEWLTTKADLAGGTLMSYETHIRVHLIPHLGRIRIDKLRVSHIRGMADAIEAQNRKIEADHLRRAALKVELGQALEHDDTDHARRIRARIAALGVPQRITGPSTIKRIRATLSSALSDAVAQMLIPVNPAKLIRLSGGKRPRGLVWTQPRVTAWRKTGQKPSPVMIWTIDQSIAFLHTTHGHPHAVAYHLMAFTGMRRGETAGLHWHDTDLDTGELTVTCQLAQIGWKTKLTAPKSEDSYRTIALAAPVVELLRAHHPAQQRQRTDAGTAWHDTNLVFTHPDGRPLHPAQLTYEFYKLVRQHDLPPIRLHDLRHGTATHALTAGIDIKLVQDLLGHTTSSFTRDTYMSVANEARRTAADTLAAIFRHRDTTTHNGTGRTDPQAA